MRFLPIFLIAGAALGQAPQVPLTGNIGAGGQFGFRNSAALVMTDANSTLTYPTTSAGFVKVTGSLTATRNIIEPFLTNQQCFENSTTGGQSIQVIGATGSGVTLANGAYACVQGDGTNYLSPPSMTYPGSGVPNSTGSAWGTSYTVGSAANNLVQLNSSAALPAVNGANLTNLNGANLQGSSVANAALANSAITVNGSPWSLGGSYTVGGGLPARVCNSYGCYILGADGTLLEWIDGYCAGTNCAFPIPYRLTQTAQTAATCTLAYSAPNITTIVSLLTATDISVQSTGVVEVGGGGSAYTGGGTYSCFIIGY